MASQLTPYIGFKDNAREAMEFYQSVLGGKLDISTFGEYGSPEGTDGSGVMHAQLVNPDGYTIMASDTPPGMPFEQGSSISMSISGDDANQMRGYFEKLADGGSVTMPMEMQMWGDEFGMLTDRFGINWMVNIAGTAAEQSRPDA